MKVYKVPSDGVLMMHHMFDTLKSHCEEYIDKPYDEFVDCYNSTYVLFDEKHAFKGMIACRRVYANKKIDKAVKYHPQKHHTLYEIEVLYYDSSVPISDRSDLINTCLADKNDAFISMECKCKNVIDDIERLKEIGFYTAFEEDDTIILARAPKTQ